MNLDLSQFGDNKLAASQSATFFISELIFVSSICLFDMSCLLRLIKKVVSSALEINLNNFVDSGKSLMYTRNNRGPKMDPCGTPVVIGSKFDLI